ncbi:hypothetical protein HDK64DRAFT_258508 [Phyllosticta capitalensis]
MATFVENAKILKGVVSDIAVTYKELFSIVHAVRFNCEAAGALNKGVYKSMTQDERLDNIAGIVNSKGMNNMRTRSKAAAIMAQEQNTTTNFTDKVKNTKDLLVDTIALIEARKKELGIFRLAYIHKVIKLSQYNAMLEDEWVRAENCLLLGECEEAKQNE